MSNQVTSKEYWDTYWTPGNLRYPTYSVADGVFYSYLLLFKKYLSDTRQRLGKQRLRVLDCGSGEGLILRFLAEQFEDLEIWGIEYSDAHFKAKAWIDQKKYDIRLIHGDLLKGWDPDFIGYFDVVASFGLIEHFKNPAEILTQMSHALTKGGCLITIIPNFDGLYNLLWKVYDSENYKYHVPIKKEALIELHNGLGLKEVTYLRLGPTTVPGIHDARSAGQKILRFLITNINGRIVQKIAPKQTDLQRSFPLNPIVTCIGYK